MLIRRPNPTGGVIKRATTAGRLAGISGKSKQIPDPPKITDYLTNRPKGDAFRVGEYLHVTDAINRCMRQIALADVLDTPLSDSLFFPSQRLTFSIGKSVEEYVIQELGKVNLYGNWGCVCGGGQKSAPMSRAEAKRYDAQCTDCGVSRQGRHTKYRGLHLIWPEMRLTGGVDIAIEKEGYIYLVECKSIAKSGFESLGNAPITDHLIQLSFYQRLAAAIGIDVFPVASVLYVCKDWQIGNPYKEMQVQIPTSGTDRLIAPVLDEVNQMLRYRQSGVLPSRVHCDSRTSPRAKKCEFAAACFSRG